MAELIPTMHRELLINGVAVGEDIMADIPMIEWSDVSDGQDTLTLTVQNDQQKYFHRHAFQRGLKVEFRGGMSGGRIATLFTGTIGYINAKGDSGGQFIEVHCTAAEVAKAEYRQPSTSVYAELTVEDVVNALAGDLGLTVKVLAKSQFAERARSVVETFFPRHGESAYQRMFRTIRECWGGCYAAIKNQVLLVTDAPQTVHSPEVDTELEWGVNIDSYQVEERSEEQPPESIQATYTPPALPDAFTDETQELIEEYLPQEMADYFNGLREGVLKNYHDNISATKAAAESRVSAMAARSGERETTFKVAISGMDPIFATKWVRIKGIGPYDGRYNVHQNDHQFGASGYSQSLALNSRRADS